MMEPKDEKYGLAFNSLGLILNFWRSIAAAFLLLILTYNEIITMKSYELKSILTI